MSRLSVSALPLLLGSIYATTGLAADVSPQVAVVRSLYERFSAEAVLEEPSPEGELVDQPMSVLSLYFDKELATLWLKDRDCVERSHEICRLDFSPLWDSQDAGGATVSIKPDTGVDSVQAVVTYGGKEKRRIHYELVRTSSGWRIHDVAFDGKRGSLRRILGGGND
jgi:hypothetical protein